MTQSTVPPAVKRSEPAETGFNPLVIWKTVRKYWLTAMVTASAVALATTFSTLGQTKIYQAASTLQLDPNPPRPLGHEVEALDMGVGSYWDNQEYYETQFRIMQSMRLALTVVRELGLEHDASFLANLPPNVQPKAPAIGVTEETAALVLRGRLRVEPIKNSRLAVLKFEDANPERAARILSAIVDSFIAQNLDDALASTNSAGDWLHGQTDKLKDDLESNERALHEYKEQKNILSLAIDDQSNMLREQMKQLNEALTSVRTKREEIAARVAELAKIRTDDPVNLPASELLGNQQLKELRSKYQEDVRLRDALIGGGKGANHPEVQAAEARVGASRSALLAEVRNIQGALSSDLSIVKRQEAGLSTLFEAANKQALELNALEIDYNKLRRSKENTEKLYALVLERSKETDLTRMLRVNNIRVVDRPLVPTAPVRPQVALNILFGLAVGIALGIAAALGRGFFDRTVKTPEDVENILGVSFLGLLPEIGEQSNKPIYYGKHRKRRAEGVSAPELVVHERPTSAIAEAARVVRTNLMFMDPDHPFKTILVTSAGPAEGKTTVATCIAIAMAQAGQSAVLVDCDLRRPRIHRVFRTGSELGVTTALMADDSLETALKETDVPNLTVLPAGPLPPNPAELLHSARFQRLLKRLAERYDRVIIDSPPVVAVTDAAILSTFVDRTIVVVRAFVTSKDLTRHALRALEDVGAKTAGVVLNAVNFERHEYKYSYYRRSDDYYSTPRSSESKLPVEATREESAPGPH